MQAKVCFLVVCLSGGSLFAQTGGQSPPPSSSSSPSRSSSSSSSSGPSGKAYIRRFSAGATLTVLGIPTLVPSGSSTVTTTPTTSSTVTTTQSTTAASSRIGYGVTGMVMLTGHFGLNGNLFFRRLGYQADTSVDNISTITSAGVAYTYETLTTSHEDTRARLMDIPVTVRYFSKSRYRPGARWFVEGGATLRKVSHIRTSLDTTDTFGNLYCCTFTATPPAHNSVIGYVVGAGLHLIDPVGVRVIPEVRFTRWNAAVFDNNTTHTSRNQLEGMISLSF